MPHYDDSDRMALREIVGWGWNTGKSYKIPPRALSVAAELLPWRMYIATHSPVTSSGCQWL